jgi:hypothetical protein
MSGCDGGGQVLLGGVPVGVVDVVVVPEAPDHHAPGSAEDPDCVLVAGAAGSGAGVDVGGPGVVVAAGVGHGRDRVAESVVACPAEAGVFGFAGFDGDGGLAAVGGECPVGGVALAGVADLGEHRRGADYGVGVDSVRAPASSPSITSPKNPLAVGSLHHGPKSRAPDGILDQPLTDLRGLSETRGSLG